MENKTNKFMAVAYKLYICDEHGQHLVEETREGQPFEFISGFGFALDAFEDTVTAPPKGQEFDLTLGQEQADGEYHDDYVLDLDRELFCIDGRFDHEHIYENAIVPLQNEEGQRFNGRVLEVGEEKVKIDMNHPLAGETLNFKGMVLENRDATEEEIHNLVKHLTGGCGNCDGDCNSQQCGCGHCH